MTSDDQPENHRGKHNDYAAQNHRPFFVLLTIVTVTSLVFVLSALSVLVYFRVRHGPQMFELPQECPGNQVWTDCGYACKVSCDQQFSKCESECSPGCECPGERPIWHLDKCIKRADCTDTVDNHTISPQRYYTMDDVFLEPDSDTLLQGGKSQDLNQFMNSIWNLDTNRFSVSELNFDLQGHTNVSSAHDVAPGSLFSNTIFSLFPHKGGTYITLIELLDQYNKNLRQSDPMTQAKRTAIDNFMDSIMEEPLIKETERFLKKQGLVSTVPFRQTLYDLWFVAYPRSLKYNTTDSSGFEHVFAGEVRKRKILGLHNWVQFYLLEKNKGLNYYGYLQALYLPHNKQLLAVNVKYVWEDQRKKQGSFLVGVSPAFDMAVYTVCFLLHPNRPCQFDLGGVSMDISTYDVKHLPGWQVETAYPVV